MKSEPEVEGYNEWNKAYLSSISRKVGPLGLFIGFMTMASAMSISEKARKRARKELEVLVEATH